MNRRAANRFADVSSVSAPMRTEGRWAGILSGLGKVILAAVLFFGGDRVHAGSSSASYTILQNGLDSTGGRIGSANYSLETSLESFGGLSAGAGVVIPEVRAGFAVQLNTPPRAESQQMSATRSSVGVSTLVAVDADRDPLTFRIVAHPTRGTLSGTPPNISYQHNGGPELEDSFTFVANDGTEDSALALVRIFITSNTVPVMDPISDQTVTEGTTLSLTFKATDADLPPQRLTYSLLTNGLPVGAVVNPDTGVFTWTPTEAQGPGSYPLTARVTDDGVPPLSATRTFTIFVTESNLPPVLQPVTDQTVRIGETIETIITATDPDLPAQKLIFTLTEAPPGATIDPVTGKFVWKPDASQTPGEVTIQVKVTDDGTPNASATTNFRIRVVPGAGWNPPVITEQDEIQLTFHGATNVCYRLETTDDFVNWVEEGAGRPDDQGRFSVVDFFERGTHIKVYRLVEIPCDSVPEPELKWGGKPGLSGRDIRFVLRGAPNSCVLIESTTDMVQWQTHSIHSTDSIGTVLFVVPADPPAPPLRLFRARTILCPEP